MLTDNLVLNIFLWILICAASVLLLYVALVLVFFIVFFLVCLTCSRNKEYTKFSKFYYRFFVFSERTLCFIANVRIHVNGSLDFPVNQKFFLVSNHRSKFDNITQAVAFSNRPMAYISKPENFKIPFVGRIVKRCLFLSIERNNLKSGLETILKASDYVKSDLISIAVFPEGTRSKDYKLGPFKPGCFKVAEKSKCPIVVIATRGTELIHKNAPFKRTDVYIDVLQVLMPEETEGKKTVELCDIAYNKISTFLKENDRY